MNPPAKQTARPNTAFQNYMSVIGKDRNDREACRLSNASFEVEPDNIGKGPKIVN
jgi:hypothetical protein